jgi:predicted nucleotidyltransferase
VSPPVLNRVETVQRVSACEPEIRALGVSRLALFGSVLRGQAHAGSDVDILVQARKRHGSTGEPARSDKQRHMAANSS